MFKPEKVKCSLCGKITKGRNPKGGDGSMTVPSIHKANGVRCLGSFSEAETIETVRR